MPQFIQPAWVLWSQTSRTRPSPGAGLRVPPGAPSRLRGVAPAVSHEPCKDYRAKSEPELSMQSGHCLVQKLQLSQTIDRQTRQDSNVGRRQRRQRGGMYSMSEATAPKTARMARPAFATSRAVPWIPTKDDHGSRHGRRPCCQIRTSPKNSSTSTPYRCPAAPRPDPRGRAKCPTGRGPKQSTAAPGGPSAP